MAQESESGNQTYSQEIAEQLRGDILSGRIAEGGRLTEQELAKRFGVGRSPVREAVLRLSMQGLLTSRPNRGAVISPGAPLEIRKLVVPIRRTVEAFALEMVFDSLTEEDFQKWEDIVARMEKACSEGDLFAIADLDIAFHRTLVERARQPDLLVIWDALVGRIRSHFRRMQRGNGEANEIYVEHKAILECFRKGSLEEAKRLLRAKID
ncbi:GntR family transcriptional regulator [Planctomicrobium sp. SH661]|uniref:GntR family transcriptional regulator n=1 Tax=Planctomicrobium sp. SH661 TaxID=3448124 RepID=UPI003F5B71AD